MKAVIIEQFGGAEKLRMADIPTPKPGPNEVQIRIRYTSVNAIDWKIREGLLSGRLDHQFPITPGWDAAGIISALGAGVKSFKLNDEVFAYCRKNIVRDGTYAEFITVEAVNVAKKPKNISFAEAAGIPLAGLTAWQALFDVGKLAKGQTVLIHAGAGGVGSLAIQFAKWAGAKVITTVSDKNIDYVKGLGASLVIDYHKDNFYDIVKKEFPKGIDLVFDMLGGDTLLDSAKLLKKGGIMVSIVEKLEDEDAEKLGITAKYLFVRPNGEELGEIAKLIEQEKIKIPFIDEMRLQDAASAQEKSRQGHTKGKIVLKVS